MQLIACPRCHTQYDVSGVVAATVPCRCGETLPNRVQSAVDVQVQRCGSCGAHAEEGLEACAWCGSPLAWKGSGSLICPECCARNADNARFCVGCGVAFAPEPLVVEGHELPCPACEILMPPTQVAGVGLNECRQCRGLWVPGDGFDAIVKRAIETRRESDAPPSPRVEGGNPMRSALRYRKCPECQSFMQRRNYRRSSGVILDVCRAHGTWLDADELEEIVGFILAGGRVSTVLEEEHRAAASDAAAAAASVARMHARTGGLPLERRSGGSLAGGLVRLLTDILS